jgi:O-acetylserine/cysteine efflux transporter
MNLRDITIMMVICFVWALNFLAGAQGVTQFSPLMFLALRFALLLTLTWPFMRLPPSGQRLRVAAAALATGTLHFCFMFWALKQAGDVSSVAIVQQTYIPIAVLLAIVFLHESVGWRTLVAIGVAFAGVLILGFDPHVLAHPLALLLALSSAFFQALGSIYIRGISGVSPMSFQAWTAALSLPIFLALTLFLESGQLAAIQSADWLDWSSIAYSAIGASIIGHGLFYYMAQKHPISTIAPYLLVMPLMTVALGVMFWGDHPGWRLLMGGALILMGVLIITLRTRRKAQKIQR